MQSLFLSNFTLRNVMVVVVDFVRLQYLSREALTIELKTVSRGARY